MKIIVISEDEYLVTDIYVKNIYAQKYCLFDLEATGPNANEDSITQVGAVVINSSGKVEKTFEALIKPFKPIPEPIERLTGIKNSELV